jgi:DNA-binding beta-propeller fold protein YncE
MATIDQAPPTPAGGQYESITPEDRGNVLNSLLARAYTLNWEMIFYIGLFIATVLTRFVNLGDRVMSHDESLHVKYSYDLYKNGNFAHTPLMHGPVLFHMTALMYFLFGDSDFSGRLYPAILGCILVFMPKLLFERWLGKLGAMVGSVLLLISPMILFHNRYIREDTPSIFFTLLMVYALLAYIDGAQPRKLRWLVLFSGAMLLSLASKEVAFMYIAIFGLFLTFLWIVQVAQGIRTGVTSPTVGWVLGGVIGVGVLAAISVVLGSGVSAKLIELGVNVAPILVTIVVAVVFAIATLVLFEPIRGLLGWAGDHGNSIFRLVIAGVIFGCAAALGTIVVLNIIPLTTPLSDTVQADPSIAFARFTWMLLIVAPMLLIIIGTAFARFSGSNWIGFVVSVIFAGLMLLLVVDVPILSRILMALAFVGLLWLSAGLARVDSVPWADIIYAALVFAVIIAIGLLAFVIELSTTVEMAIAAALLLALIVVGFIGINNKMLRLPWGDIAVILIAALASAAVLVFFEERSKLEKSKPSGYNEIWIWGSWVVSAAICVGVLFLRFFTKFFQEMKRYLVFDVLIVMGTLILPWLAALPIYQAGYPLDGSYLGQDIIWACVRGLAPFIIVSIVVGVCWDIKAWLMCAAAFYSLFAFFFTTIFTNIAGTMTGMVGSLGYWLAQQGVRRGSQPQYYYLLVELPIYEYLPVIGATVAGVIGMLGFWRVRHEQIQSELAARAEAPAEGFVAAERMADDGDLNPIPDMSSAPTQTFSETEVMDIVTQAQAAQAEQQGIVDLPPLPDESSLPPLEGDDLIAATAPTVSADDEILARKPSRSLPIGEALDRFPFLPFVGYWGLMIIFAFTLAGEKMPWLTTHLTVPLIFVTARYLGSQLENIEWEKFFKQGWGLIILTPVLVVALANVVGPCIFGNAPFGGIDRDSLLRTFTWMGAVILAGLLGYGIFWIWRRVGTQQSARTIFVGIFALLILITARTAWMAAYINYDTAREFMVYAHGAPADKDIMRIIDDISRRTTDGKDIKVAYDNEISWPGTWYFREYPNARYLGDKPATAGNLDDYLAIVVGNGNNKDVEPLLTDKYYKMKLIRMWWPMQDYFDLNRNRVNNIFSGDTNLPQNWFPGSKIRQGIWDIWWNRDYTAYGKAVNKTFDESQWPVADWLYFYVRKDVAAQVWDFGTGAVKVQGLPEDDFGRLRCDACQPNSTFASKGTESGQLAAPRDITVGPDGKLYVMDSQNARIAVFDTDGNFVRQFGHSGAVEAADPNNPASMDGAMREPWGLAVGNDGTIYVADTWNHRVQVFSNDGTFLRKWGKFEQAQPGGTIQPDTFWGPRDIAVDADNNVYVADTGNKRVRVYDNLGNYKFDIGTDALNEPVGLAINQLTREIYIADTWNKRIQVFSLDGAALRSWNVQAWVSTAESGNRPYLSLDKTGKVLFVTDPDAGRVLAFDPEGKALVTFSHEGGLPAGIAADAAGRLFVAESNNSMILRYTQENLPVLAPQGIQPSGNQQNSQQGQLPTDDVTQEATPVATDAF